MSVTPELLAAELGKAAAPHIGKLLARIGRKQFDKFVVTSTNVFSDHLKDTVARCSTTKNILYRDPVPLVSQYVTTNFIAQQNPISDERIIEYTRTSGIRCLITGTAGSGKSMFMKWLSLQLGSCIITHQRIPLYIEARNLSNESLEDPLERAVFQATSTERSNATFDQFQLGLQHGIFIILVDGLDEISPHSRDMFLRGISDFRRRYPDTSIICSSRPERQIESLADLQVLRMAGMSLDQVKEVISNAVFDPQKKEGFLRELEAGLYEDHVSFLSNPLLAIIMLIMFDNNSNVPRKLSAFYSQIFETLFFRHDSSKGVYTRQHFAALEIDQFDEVFRSLSFETYAMNKVRFTETEIMELVRSSLKRCGLMSVAPELYIRDCKQSVCLMQDDGLETSYVHRSFQEYFAARYMLYYKGDAFAQVLDRLALRSGTDNVLPMLYEMNAIEVKRLWIVDRLNSFVSMLSKIDQDDASMVFEFVSKYIEFVEVDKRTTDISSVSFTREGRPIYSIISLLAREAEFSGSMLLAGRMFGGVGGTIGEFLLSDKVQEAELRNEITDLLKRTDNRNPRIYFGPSSEVWIEISNFGQLLNEWRIRLSYVASLVENQTSANDDFAADILRIMQT